MRKESMRVLTTRELYNAMGLPANFTIDQSGRRKEVKRNICLTEAEMKRVPT